MRGCDTVPSLGKQLYSTGASCPLAVACSSIPMSSSLPTGVKKHCPKPEERDDGQVRGVGLFRVGVLGCVIGSHREGV